MKNRGFTLIEVIITISLLILISSISIYSYNFSNVLSDMEVQNFISDINYVKSLNTQGDSNVKIVLDMNKNSYTIYKNNKYSETVNLKNIKIESYNNSGGEIQFYKNSWTTGNTITLSYNGTKHKITISAITGNVRFE